MAKGKFSNALANAKGKVRKTVGELESVKKLRAMDKKELKKLGTTAAVAAVGGGIAGYTLQKKIAEQPEDKISADSVLRKGVGGFPILTVGGVVGAIVAAKKLQGAQAVAVSAALGGLAGGAWAYGEANKPAP
jgi:hypothetical protein